MKYMDLTHLISDDMPVFPGTETPNLTEANTLEKDGFKETLLEMYSHTGTHMDAPAHLFKKGVFLDEMPMQTFVGQAAVVDCTNLHEGDKICLSQLKGIEDKLNQIDFLLFNTGWNKKWGTPEYYGEFPVASQEVLEVLIQNNIKGIGLDTISLDPMADENLTLHRVVLSQDMVIIENLVNLDKIKADTFLFCALPLKYKNADGAPIRAVAIVE